MIPVAAYSDAPACQAAALENAGASAALASFSVAVEELNRLPTGQGRRWSFALGAAVRSNAMALAIERGVVLAPRVRELQKWLNQVAAWCRAAARGEPR